MVQQTNDSMFDGNRVQNTETAPHEKLPPIPSRKTALKDLQTENIITVSKSMGSPPLSKEQTSTVEIPQLSGSKRASSPSHQSPSSNGQLAYVRRKVAKGNSPIDTKNIIHNTDSSSLNQHGEARLSSIPALAPLPKESLMNYSSAKPSIPLHPEKLGDIPSSVVTTVRENRLHWEDRAFQLQKFLSKLDQSDQEDCLQELRSLSSAELSRHAVKLEKRTIQLALEEGKEMDKVMFLNILGKSAHLDQ